MNSEVSARKAERQNYLFCQSFTPHTVKPPYRVENTQLNTVPKRIICFVSKINQLKSHILYQANLTNQFSSLIGIHRWMSWKSQSIIQASTYLGQIKKKCMMQIDILWGFNLKSILNKNKSQGSSYTRIQRKVLERNFMQIT